MMRLGFEPHTMPHTTGYTAHPWFLSKRGVSATATFLAAMAEQKEETQQEILHILERGVESDFNLRFNRP